MAAGDGLPEELLRFIQLGVPDFDAAELLLFLSRHADKHWKPEEIVDAIRPTVITIGRIRGHLEFLGSRGLVVGTAEGFRFAPASQELTTAVALLSQAYEERPVTLIRAINIIADRKLQSFSDSFKFKWE